VVPGAPVAGTEVRRLAGTDRVATAIELSRTAFAAAATPDVRRAGEVVLAAADRFPDALVAAPYAAAFEAPVLLNPSDRLDPRVRAEIDRVLGGQGPVTLMGGVNAIGLPVEAELRAAGYTVSRIAGQDRYDTSVQVAQLLPAEVVVLARGDAFPDALAAGPAAAELGGAVLLTAGRELPDSVRAYLDEQPDVVAYAVGGQAAAAVPDAEPVAGADRYDTAGRVAARFFRTPPRTVVASGERFPDALAGGALAALTGSPLLLATRTSLPAPSAAALERVGPYHRVVALAGGSAVLDDAVRSAVQRAAAG
jgi:putative cell wall-binding protein